MISDALHNIITISLMCSGVALFTLFVRKIIGKSSGAWWRSIIWVLLLIRLCVPVSVQSPIGVMDRIVSIERANEIQTETAKPATDIHTPLASIEQIPVQQAPESHIVTENAAAEANGLDWAELAGYAYIATVAVFALLFLIRVALLSRKMAGLKICRDKRILDLFDDIKKQMGIKRKIVILIEPDADTPALSGMFFPSIIIPESVLSSTNVSELEYILIHELMHYKRRDIAKLWLLEITMCIHWFNPVLHLIKPTIVQDFELACDERVLTFINNSEYAGYGNVLVHFSTKKKSRNPLVATSNFAGKKGQNLKERLEMIKIFNKKKIIIFGIVLVAALSAVLVSCTSFINREDTAASEDSVKVKYMDYYYTPIPEQYLDKFLTEFKKAELEEAENGDFGEEMYGDYRYRISVDSKGYMLYTDKNDDTKFYLEHGKGKDEPWDYYVFESGTFASLLADIQNDVLEYGELIKYDKQSYEEVYALLNGKMTLQAVAASKNWTFYERKSYYLMRAIFPDENEYNVTLESDRAFSKRYLDYDHDYIKIYNADKDEYIENPTPDSFIEFIKIPTPTPTEPMLNETPQGYDINVGNGHIIETLIEIVEARRPIGDLTEEFNMQYDGASYRMSLFTSTDEYEIELIDGGTDIDTMLDYEVSQLNIVNNTDRWTLNNPTSEDITIYMMEEYYAQREAWRIENTESRYSGNFITIASPDGQTKIDLTSEAAERIASGLRGAENKIILNDYRDTDKEFHMKGLEIFLEGMGYEYPVPLWINSEGTKAIGFANEPIPVSETVYDMIAAIAQEQSVYEEGDINDIHDLVSVELIVNERSQGTLTDKADVGAIETMLTGSEIMNGIGKCPFGAKLIMTRADGHVIEAVLPVDSCGYFILGTATCYQYDRADSSDQREYTQQDLLKHFGMSDFSDVNYEFSEQDIKSAEDVIERYFKAQLDKDSEAFVSLTHPDRNITMERVADGEFVLWEEEKITLIEIKPYDAAWQKKFNYHKDNNNGNTIILKVDFEVEFPDGYKSSPYNEGVYKDWTMILIREELSGQWYVYDQGY